jgi:transposase
MLSLPSHVAIYLHTEPTDMRKGFDGLSGVIRGQFGSDPQDSSLFVFVNRRQDRMKMLHWDGSGYWLYYRRLEAGTFEVPRSAEGRVQIDAAQLAMLLAGIPLRIDRRRKRYRVAS